MQQECSRSLVDHLQRKLEDTRFEGAGDLPTARWTAGDGRHRHSPTGRTRRGCRPLRSADVARQIKVRVVEQVVSLGAEFELEALHRRIEPLVQIEIGLVEWRRAAWIARRVAEWAEDIARRIVERRNDEGVEVDVIHIAG